jgi:serine protease AprX
MRLFDLLKVIRMSFSIVIVSALILCCPLISICTANEKSIKQSPADIISQAAAEGKLAYKLATPDELKSLLGPAENEDIKRDGGMEKLELKYPGVQVTFSRMRGYSTPFTLLWINVKGKWIDTGQTRQVVLNNEDDLKKFDPFWGFAGISLEKLNLRNYAELLAEMPFDSRTKWPDSDKLPDDFNPVRLLDEGKNPGLGIRSLHKQGIDGRGIGIAILDQPLLKDHIEYKNQLVLYEKKHLLDMAPAMHGAPLASIAVGKNCGVAPKALLYYFAMRMTAMPDNKIYCNIIDKIIKMNEEAGASEKIRVVSISTGTFRQQKNYELWKETLKKAEQNGILVVTCSGDWLRYGTLKLIPGMDRDNPLSYIPGKYSTSNDVLLVPTSNKTTASHHGPEIYTYDTEGGMSSAAPYLAGLAALAYQVNPEIKSKQIVELLQETAAQTNVGAIVQPEKFIEAVRKNQSR